MKAIVLWENGIENTPELQKLLKHMEDEFLHGTGEPVAQLQSFLYPYPAPSEEQE